MGLAQKTGMDRSAGDPDVWIGLDHLRFGMDHGVWIACGTGVWIGTLHFEPQPYIYCETSILAPSARKHE